MKRIFSKLVFALAQALAVGDSFAQPQPPIPDGMSTSVEKAESAGRTIAAAVAQDLIASAEEETAVRSKVRDACDLKYKVYKIVESDRTVFYMIALPPSTGSIVFGRHYRVEDNSVTPSTKTCFIFPAQPGAVAAVSTHLLGETPTEFHVLLSLVQELPIVIATSYGNWAVLKSRIRFMQRR